MFQEGKDNEELILMLEFTMELTSWEHVNHSLSLCQTAWLL